MMNVRLLKYHSQKKIHGFLRRMNHFIWILKLL